MSFQMKHFRLSERDLKHLKLIKKYGDCVSDNEAVRLALKKSTEGL